MLFTYRVWFGHRDRSRFTPSLQREADDAELIGEQALVATRTAIVVAPVAAGADAAIDEGSIQKPASFLPPSFLITMSAHEIEALALQLPREQRAALAQHLIASLEEADDVEQAWADEAARRYEALRSGETTGITATDVFADARTALR
jgi:putative addiction module component (TIGR02574 family)